MYSAVRSAITTLSAALATLLLFAALPSPWYAARASAEPSSQTLPFTGMNPIGANFFLSREVEGWKKEQTMKLAREMGIGWVKEIFAWEEIEPRKGYFFNDRYRVSTWAKYDEIVDLAEKNGMRVIARLDRPPTWSRKDNRLDTAPPDRLSEYVDFVGEVVKRYKGRVQFFQIWNEPNIYPEWGERAPDPAGYVEMLRAARARAKEIDPNVVILSAPLAQTLETSARNLNELDYLEGMYHAGGRGSFDILSANVYGFEYPPDAAPDRNTLNFSRVKLLREVMERNDDGDRAIWFNEFGWNASPEEFPRDRLIWRRVSETEQAKYTLDAFKLAQSWGWAGVQNIWYFRQVGDLPPERSDYYFRLVDTDFTPRPVYLAMKEYSDAMRVASPGTVEELAAAVATSGRWSVRLDPDASGGVMLQAASPDARATLTFSGTEAALVSAVRPGAGRYVVTVDGKDPGLANKNPQGRSVVDLNAPQPEAQKRLPLTRQLSRGKHAVMLEPDGPGGRELLIDAFIVDDRQPPPSLLGDNIPLALGIAALVAGMVFAGLAARARRKRTR